MKTVPQRSRNFHSLSLPVFKWGRRKLLRFAKFAYVDDDDTAAVVTVNRISSIYRQPPPSGSRLRRENREHAGKRSEKEKRRRSPLEPERKFSYSSPSWYSASQIGQTRRKSFVGGEDEELGIEAVRTKLMLDFQTEVDRMKVEILNEGKEEEEEIEPLPPSRTEEEIRPWNLRTRRPPPCNDAAATTAGKSLRIEDRNQKPTDSPLRNGNKVPRLRSETAAAVAAASAAAAAAAAGECAGDKRPGISRPKFSLSLSKSEIEKDLIAITGSKPQRRPKKRPRSVQRQMDCIFPGNWLSEITPEMYKVDENY